MKKMKRAAALALIAIMLLLAAGCGEKESPSALDPEEPVTVTVWNYYNGKQLSAFEALT